MIRRPDRPDPVAGHQHEAGCIDVGQASAPQAVQHPPRLVAQDRVGVQHDQPVEVVDQEPEPPSRLFPVPVEKPGYASAQTNAEVNQRGVGPPKSDRACS